MATFRHSTLRKLAIALFNERIIMKLYTQIDHNYHISNDLFVFAVSPELTKILPIEKCIICRHPACIPIYMFVDPDVIGRP